MTADEMTILTQKQLDAYNARDIEAFASCFHDEITILELISGKVRLQGIEAFRARYGEMFMTSPDLRCELRSRIVVSAAVVDEEWITGQARYPEGMHAVAVFGFRDKKIDRVTFVM